MRSMLLLIAMNAFLSTASAAELKFHDTLAAAQSAEPADPGRPTVISFGADWCGWCRKMHADTFTDQRVTSLAPRFGWAKIDIDEQPETAAQFRIRGVPAVAIIDGQGRLLAQQSGFMAAEAMARFLNEALDNPQPIVHPVDALLATAMDGYGGRRSAAIAALVERLARPEREDRERILAGLAATGNEAWPALADLLDDDRLAVRAAAAHALRSATGERVPFHPFAPADERHIQSGQWRLWIDERVPQPAIAETP